MSAPIHLRPFNIEHAKAGAPYCTIRGHEATISKWDGRQVNRPLVGFSGPKDEAITWAVSGEGPYPADQLVMLPLGFIDDRPVFTDDELAARSTGVIVKAEPTFRAFDAFAWPEPSKRYPESLMTDIELLESAGHDNREPLRILANAVLRHAIECGQVVLPSEPEKVSRVSVGAKRTNVTKPKSVAVSRLVRLPALIQMLGLSRSSIYGHIAQGLLTSPVRLGPRASGWPTAEIEAILDARIAGKTGPQIQEIVRSLIASRGVRA